MLKFKTPCLIPHKNKCYLFSKKNPHAGLFALTFVSILLTIPFFYYTVDIAHSLRHIAQK